MTSSFPDSTPPLPPDFALDIPAFARAFRDTNTSYKFIWASAFLRALEEDDFRPREIPFRRLAAGMLDAARRPVYASRLRIGKDDKTGLWFEQLEASPRWDRKDMHQSQGRIFSARPGDIPGTVVAGLTKYAPFLFLSPFFEEDIPVGVTGSAKFRKIRELANGRFNDAESAPPPYCFPKRDSVVFHPSWAEYIGRNFEIIRSWVLWNWARHLQQKNANIPGIVQKLDENAVRDTEKQKRFWERAMESRPARLSCIYTGEPVAAKNFHLDHYIPWSFAAHDRIWNLVPVSERGNAEKSDRLPDDKHFAGFAELQHAAVRSLHNFPAAEKRKWENIFEPYSDDLNLDVVSAIPDKAVLREALAGAINPLLSLAKSRGFPPFSEKGGNGIL